jgi:uncharacterized membrane protein YkoI
MKHSLLTSLLAFLLFMSTSAQADIGKQEAVSIAQQVFPGRVLAVKQAEADTGPVYRVKTLSAAGDVHIVVIDAESGKVISK